MEQMIEIVNQIHELSGVLLEALQQAGAGGGEGGPPAEGPPAEGPPAEGPPAEGPPAEGPPPEEEEL